jgi:hypothetical protein
MINHDRQAYLDLCQRLLDEREGDEDTSDGIEMLVWIPATSKVKENMEASINYGVIDLSNIKGSKIKEQLSKGKYFKVDGFSIKVITHDPVKDQFYIMIYEDKNKTPLGRPCKMTYKLKPTLDTRFDGRPWLSYFTYYDGSAKNIPADGMVEIVRFLQIIKKLSAFI